LKYPPRAEPDGSLNLFKLDDNPQGGLQVLGVVASRKPLPTYWKWKEQRGKTSWAATPAGAAVWVADLKGTHPVDPIVGVVDRGSFVNVRGVAPLQRLNEELQRAPGIETVELWAFPVLAKEK
jgi:hypothetical protein